MAADCAAVQAALEQALTASGGTERRVLTGPVAPAVDVEALRREVTAMNLETGCGTGAVEQALALLEGAAVHTFHPRYFGLFNPAPALWGQVADLISARLNPQLAVWSHAPAAVEMERAALRLVAERIGMPGAGAFFTSGGEEANRAGVQVALTRAFPDVAELGLRALPAQPVFYVSSESHLAWVKIAAGLGLGRSAVRLVPVDGDFAMSLSALRDMLEGDRRDGLSPFLIGATAGTTSAGTIDPLPELGELAAAQGLSLHVDAAWAGAAVLSDRWRPALDGIERADTVTIDAHKWLSQPMGTGMFFSRRADLLDAAFGVSASYMPPDTEGAVDFYRTSPQWSRPFRGLRLFLTLAVLGRSAYEAQIDRDVALGDQLREALKGDGWAVLNRTPFPVACFTRAGRHMDAAWHRGIADRVVRSGEAWISTVHLSGRPALRACISNFRTSHSDIGGLLAALRAAHDQERA
ncbi:MAG TPA: pyridoxal-dependent decarboxylase [Chloroflexota bacterium]|nr:pyridoxal-dependent decarboxylase [Chloroflexota bacterium]